MAEMVKLSGVANQSGVLHVLSEAGVDERMLSRLEYATADAILQRLGLELAVQRDEILSCVTVGTCIGHVGVVHDTDLCQYIIGKDVVLLPVAFIKRWFYL